MRQSAVYPFRYYGGKVQILSWLINQFPKSFSFVDVFGGSGVVSLNVVDRYKRVVWNDIDRNVVNFFKVLRDDSEELIRLIELTPVARDEHHAAWEYSDYPVENARRFFVRMTQSFNNYGLKGRCSWLGGSLESKKSRAGYVFARVKGLEEVVRRLQHIEIENKPFHDLIEKESHPDNFFFSSTMLMSPSAGAIPNGRKSFGSKTILRPINNARCSKIRFAFLSVMWYNQTIFSI